MDDSPHPLFDWRIVENRDEETWVSWLSPQSSWLLSDHRILGDALVPGTGYVEIVRAAFELSNAPLAAGELLEICDLTLFNPLRVADDEEREVRTVLTATPTGTHFRVTSRAESSSDGWEEHASGEVARVAADAPPRHDPAELAARCSDSELVDRGAELAPSGEHVAFGPRWTSSWAGLRHVWLGPGVQLARIEIDPEFAADLETYQLHPALLDVAVTYVHPPEPGEDAPFLPFCYERLRMRRALPPTILVYIESLDTARDDTVAFDITIMDESGEEVVKIDHYSMRRLDVAGRGAPSGATATGDGNRILRLETSGMLETLAFHPGPRTPPGDGEIEIEVETVGLNFKDVLFALGVMGTPGESPDFGYEVAGRVVAVGGGVTDFAVGDEVLSIGLSCFRRFVTTPAFLAARKPAHISFEEAATIPNAFFTAYYALVELGRLRAGERVLIHTAAGGVGMAAVTVSQWIGAEIFATAGSPEKRSYLESRGIRHVMDSRSLEFAERIPEVTDGAGVDVVLNSLAGEYIPKGLAVLGPYGRFLELGVRDIYADTPLGMRPFEKGLSFIAVMVTPDVPNYRGIWLALMRHFEDRHFEPLPHRVFAADEVAQAFEFMARAKHIGKVVVTLAGVS